MIESIDSFYRAVKQRIITVNPQRVVKGPLDAADWPPKIVDMEAFYLVTLPSSDPIGRQGYSPYSMFMSHSVQWLWIIAGDDLASNMRGKNRGNRYRKNWQMKKELLTGLFPYFTEKLQWSAEQVGNQIQLQSASMVDPGTGSTLKESIIWTPARFTQRTDKNSGLIYGVAIVNLTEMTDAVVA